MRIQTPSPVLRFLAAGTLLSLITITALVFGIRQHFSDASGSVVRTSSTAATSESKQKDYSSSSTASTASTNGSWEFVVERDGNNYGLSEEQCRIAFPKLFVEIDKSVAKREGRPISFKEVRDGSGSVDEGMVRGMVVHGELYIIDYQALPVTYSRAKATLNSLHRALMSFPDRYSLPSVEFIFTTEDFAGNRDNVGDGGGKEPPIWAYSKRDEDDSVWLMPDFGYWSWPEVKIGAYQDVRRRMAVIDDGITATGGSDSDSDATSPHPLPFKDKKKQLVWRGSLATNPELRSKFLKSTLGRSWASVRVIDWDDPNDLRFNLLPMEEHCRYMFLGHTEGRSFSGRGKYLLNCRSVVISHKLIWKEAHHAALISSGPDANHVEVQRDFSDLERKVDYLIDHPDAAERIANNAVRTFRDRYLTPAAEACYWRALIRGYASVSGFEPGLYSGSSGGRKQLRGVPFETWILTS